MHVELDYFVPVFFLLLLHKWQFVKKWQIKANCCGTKIHLFFFFFSHVKIAKEKHFKQPIKKKYFVPATF